MLHRTYRSVVIALSVTATLGTGWLWMPPACQADANDLTLRFDEVESFARAESPRIQIIMQEVAATEAETDAALNWSNPSIAYDHEEADSFREWQVTLGKRFDAPFAQSNVGGGREARIRSAELRADQRTRQLVAELKAGYVRLQLLDEYLDRLDRLSELVALTSTVAENRHSEGELSRVERELVQLAAYSVDAARRRVRQAHRLEASAWRTDMGFGPGVVVKLATPSKFTAIELAEAGEYTQLLADHPGTLAALSLAESLRRQSEAAGPSLVPGLDIYGGYKRIESDVDGLDVFVAGIAVDLPFFDRNAGASTELEAERLIVEHELALSLARSSEEIESLVALIQDAQPSLGQFSSRMQDLAPLADTLLFSYREGSLTLDALLGALQIEASALQNYYDEITTYYLNLFRLEALTGATIVQFAS